MPLEQLLTEGRATRKALFKARSIPWGTSSLHRGTKRQASYCGETASELWVGMGATSSLVEELLLQLCRLICGTRNNTGKEIYE